MKNVYIATLIAVFLIPAASFAQTTNVQSTTKYTPPATNAPVVSNPSNCPVLAHGLLDCKATPHTTNTAVQVKYTGNEPEYIGKDKVEIFPTTLRGNVSASTTATTSKMVPPATNAGNVAGNVKVTASAQVIAHINVLLNKISELLSQLTGH